ncbi:enzyme E2 Q2 [Seminavis robusta]|uniref:Enzyme E2 Q2 n=1 Tax=Seminavis robusta TaxID=568900 RepID=A0A9N8DJG0_9STRA|nr:enzyme E2 Q2 [Seminavis robusta]|eukprot:Sro117_g057440.1 enzyme E2 Q2 (470) ;mRNA; r:76788-78272
METSKATGASASAAVRTVSTGNSDEAAAMTLSSSSAEVVASDTCNSSPASLRADSASSHTGTSMLRKGTTMINSRTIPASTSTMASIGKHDAEEDAGVIAAPADTLNTSSFQSNGGPAEIPPEPSSESLQQEGRSSVTVAIDGNSNDNDGGDGDNDVDEEQAEEEEEDDESEYEYEDDEDAAFSGFLVDNPPLAASLSAEAETNASGSAAEPARIRDEEESINTAAVAKETTGNAAAKWREPSRAAVSMSLRAETEKTGSKRRLAQDLYRIMNQDTEEAGFSIGPKSEDCMDHWTIKLFKFDSDSNLAKDMLVLGFEYIELEMTFPDQYPFEPPFVRVVRPRFKRQTGFVMNGALCMELLTKDGWNPVNDIESVIVSIRSLLVVGDGRLQAAHDMPEPKYQARLKASKKSSEDQSRKRQKKDDESEKRSSQSQDGGSYTVAEAHAAYSHLSDYHKKKGWDSSGWWARKG